MLMWALVAIGGALGAVSRYGIDRAVAAAFGAPTLGTFAVNISGSFLLGILLGLGTAEGRFGLSNEARALTAVGFLGSYTTFSTLTVASVRLAADGDWLRAALNIAASVIAGIIAAFAGIMLGRAL